MGERFERLCRLEQEAVTAHVGAEYHRLVSLRPPTYTAQSAQADPEGWQDRFRELIASDPKRVRAIVERAGWKEVRGDSGSRSSK